jgi:hypothetical protein
LFYPFQSAWNLLLLRAEEQRLFFPLSLLRWNAAFWDELQYLSLYGLDLHLVITMERDRTAGAEALETISTGRQRWAAQAAQIELDARDLEQCTTTEAIARAHTTIAAGELEGPASALLRSFSLRSADTAAALAQLSNYNQRLVLQTVEDDLNGRLRELTRSGEPYAARFRPIAHQWRRIIAGHIQSLLERAMLRHEVQNPYIVGTPLTRRQEVFVGRTDVIARIEQLLAASDHPPLLLYGQRRMGKTSLLYNLRWMLPSHIAPFIVDLQGPVATAGDHNRFLYNLARQMNASAQRSGLTLPPVVRAAFDYDPFTVFHDWLDELEQMLIGQDITTIILALDEFEALDYAFTHGPLQQELVLGTLRHLIQHRPRFKLLLAGSHTLEEFRRWSSYLINTQLIPLTYLHADETRQLIERPIQDFALRYEPAASKHIMALTRGHPYLTQLMCSEVVELKNEQPSSLRRLVQLQDVETAIPRVLVRGSQFFADIELNQVDENGLHILNFLAHCDEERGANIRQLETHASSPKNLDDTLALLLRRELIEEIDSEYFFQVDLIRRWFERKAY